MLQYFRLIVVSIFLLGTSLQAGRFDQIAVDRYAKLREVEKYQLNIAEKYYGEKNWKVAAAEYEKFLTLYERSDAGSYAQLKWSLCQSNLKNKNTAISEGFQSVIDYWPDSADAIGAAYYMGVTYKEIGEVSKAKKAYQQFLKKHGEKPIAAYALNQLQTIHREEGDAEAILDVQKKLTFDIERAGDRTISGICAKASRDLAQHYFGEGVFEKGVEALETTYSDQTLISVIVADSLGAIRNLCSQAMTKAKGEKLADLAVAHVKQQIPAAPETDQEKQQALASWNELTRLQDAAGRESEVVKIYEEMLKKFGNLDDILMKYGAWHLGKGHFAEARKVYGRFKDAIEGQNQIALSYRREKQVDAAVRTYQNLMGQDSENITRWLEQIARTYDENNQYAKAISVYERLLKEDVENSQKWLWAIAGDYERSGQLKQAIGYYRQCNDYFPGNTESMARCHRKLKQFGEAIVLYNQIVGGSESHAPQASIQIGYTLEEAGKKEQAIKQFQNVCKRYPKNRYASIAHAHLQNTYKITVTLGGTKDEN